MAHTALLRIAALAFLFLLASSQTFSPTLISTPSLGIASWPKASHADMRMMQEAPDSIKKTQANKAQTTKPTNQKASGQAAKDQGQIVISPEFAQAGPTHLHDQPDLDTGAVFESFITQAFSDLSSYAPQQQEIHSIGSLKAAEVQAPAPQESQEDRTPSLSELRNINIDELPETFP